MSRNRPRSPRYADHLLARLTAAAEQLVDVLRPTPPTLEELPQVNQTVCRLLSLRHLGQWVEIPGRPVTKEEREHPSQLTIAGVLVGIRPGAPGRQGGVATRTLVIAQGGQQRDLAVRVDEPVNTYPRSTR